MKDYIKQASRTDLKDYSKPIERLSTDSKARLLHATLGLVTESGEFADMMKKHIMYGKELDRVNLVEEAGDLLWYLALALNELGVSLERTMQINIEKLKVRYPEKFEETLALNRELDQERKTLEGQQK